MLEKAATERREEADIEAGLKKFAALVSSNLEHISFDNRPELLRMVLDRVVVRDWRVDVHYGIPLPKPDSQAEAKAPGELDLRSRCKTMKTMLQSAAA